MAKQNNDNTWKIISGVAIGLLIIVLLFFAFNNQNNNSSNENQNTNLEDTQTEKIIYANTQDLEIKLSRTDFGWVGDAGETCPNGHNSFYLIAEASLNTINQCDDNGSNCPSYSCTFQLIKGNHPEYWDWEFTLNPVSNDYVGGYGASSQSLKEEQQVKICCSPCLGNTSICNSDYIDNQRTPICKTESLEPYC